MKREVEGYADRVSALPGESVAIHVSATEERDVRWSLYRMGYYGGAGARLLLQGATRAGPQPPCPVEEETALVRCEWSETFRFVVPEDALSGLYLVRLDREDGFFRFVPLVVRDERKASLLLQASTSTYQAYNRWGGSSLYQDATGRGAFGRAVKVSFDRPYEEDDGAGQMLLYDFHVASFLERHGYDVSYTTNTDVASLGLDGLGKGQVFLSVGHDEYWSGEQREALDRARSRGVSLFFFGANTGYWKTRFEDGGRVLASYKGVGSTKDPMAGSPAGTGLFRAANIDRPENELLGVMYESWVYHSVPLVVADPKHFLFRGTGLEKGDRIPFVVGYEYDRRFENGRTPRDLRVAARSPILDVYGAPGWAETTTYRASSGALVFASGTIEWAWGLGKEGVVDPRIGHMTANLIEEATGIPVPKELASMPAPPRSLRSDLATQLAAEGMVAPVALALLSDGTAAVADPRDHRIWRIRGGKAEVLAGDGHASSDPALDGVPGHRARLHGPTGIAAIGDEVYFSDTMNHCIRKIAADGVVSTVAGSMGEPGDGDGSGAGARLNYPQGLAFDPRAGTLVVADTGNRKIRRVRPATGETSTLAGGGFSPGDGPALQVGFYYPTDVAVSPAGDVFVVDTRARSIWIVSPDGTARRIVAGEAGEPRDGNGREAALSPQGGAAWDGAGLLVSEPAHLLVRRVIPGADPDSTRVETVAGPGPRGKGFQVFGLPVGLAVDDGGRVWVADPATGSVRTFVPAR